MLHSSQNMPANIRIAFVVFLILLKVAAYGEKSNPTKNDFYQGHTMQKPAN